MARQKTVKVSGYTRSAPAKSKRKGEKQVKAPAGRPPMPKGGKPGQYQWSSAQQRWVNLGAK